MTWIRVIRPDRAEGHMALYRAVLYHRGNSLPPWLLEAVGVYVSRLNGCDYCMAIIARACAGRWPIPNASITSTDRFPGRAAAIVSSASVRT